MTTETSVYPLLTWLSPAYPVGAYTYSHGLEYAVEHGLVSNAPEARDWITDLLIGGSGRSDLVFLREAWESADDPVRLAEIVEFATAFQPSREIRLESTAQGAAFLRVSLDAWFCAELENLRSACDGDPPYPVVVGVAARGHGVDTASTLRAYAHAFVANLVSAAVRLVPLGQTDGQRITAGLSVAVEAAVGYALETALENVTNAAVCSDICSMRHETQYTRLFRS